MVSNNSERSGEYLLEMSNINKSFPGVKALDNVNLKVRPHSIHALMGENGAGKSTLLKCLFGIDPRCGRYQTGEHKDNNLGAHHRDAGQARRLFIAANSQRITAKGGFV